MKRKKRSQGIRDKNTRKNYNNNIKVSNSKSRFDVNSSEDTHSPPPSSSIDSSLMQKSLSASTITKKQGEKISSGVIDSSKYEPAREKKEGESLSSIALQYRNNKNQGNDGKRNFGNNKSNIKNNNNYNNSHIGGTSGMLQNPAIAWFDMYNELSRNAARMTERWLNLFWNPWITSERKNNNTKK
jgi:hypothetical protein